MSQPLHASLVRIRNFRGDVVGSGFLALKNLILTCAHVVEQSIRADGLDNLDLILTSPMAHFSGKVVFQDAEKDIACIEVIGELSPDAVPVPMIVADNLWGHGFRAFGFPVDYVDGAWASGILRDKNGAGWLQIEADKQTGYRVQPGFSGAPVWDEKLNAVVGMVVAAEQDEKIKAAFCIPTNVLIKAWPPLRAGVFWPVTRLETTGDAYSVPAKLQVGKVVKLGGTDYLIREIIAQSDGHDFALHTLRASNLSLNQDVGIRLVASRVTTPEAKNTLRQLDAYIRKMSRCAVECEHLARVSDQGQPDPQELWVITEWIKGIPLMKHFPSSGALPTTSGLVRLIGWTVDVCAALRALHREQISPIVITSQNILSTRSRGAVLVDGGFAESPSPLHVRPPVFDPVGDLRNLAGMVYQLATRQTPSIDRFASASNPAIPASLDELLRDGLSGKFKRAEQFRNGLLEVRRRMNSH